MEERYGTCECGHRLRNRTGTFVHHCDEHPKMPPHGHILCPYCNCREPRFSQWEDQARNKCPRCDSTIIAGTQCIVCEAFVPGPLMSQPCPPGYGPKGPERVNCPRCPYHHRCELFKALEILME